MAVWKADFDMSLGGDTSKRSAAASRKAALEAGKQEIKGKMSRALQKLMDRDTQQGAIEELLKICRELKPEHTGVVLSQLFDFENAKSSFARSNAAKLFAIVAEVQFHPSRKNVGKIIETLCCRMRDLDSSVRESCAETIGEMARLICAVDPGQSCEETVDLDSSVMSVTVLNDDKNPSLDLFFRPIFHGMSSADNNQQQGCALALAHVLFKAGKKIDPFLEAVSKRILEKMDSTQFSGRPQLLNAISNLVEVYPDGISPLIRHFMPRVFNAAINPEWNTRKHAMETIETMAARLDPNCLVSFKQDVCAIVEKNKFDKVKPVRDAALQAFQTLTAKSLFERDQDSKSERFEASQTETSIQDENAEPHSRSVAAGESTNAVLMTPRMPMQQLNSTSGFRLGNNKSDQPNESYKLQAPYSISSFAHEPNVQSMSASAPFGPDTMPSKDTWDKLLMHFDKMTQQQTQLIEMVSAFSESARERLETVEQKVFAMELRMAAMENRQSLPGMPPTPSRAIFCGTPAASAIAKMNPCPEADEGAAVDADFCP